MPNDEHAPTIEQRLSALISALEATNAAFNARMDAEGKARAEFETLSQLRGKR